jgi:hypothetical protein
VGADFSGDFSFSVVLDVSDPEPSEDSVSLDLGSFNLDLEASVADGGDWDLRYGGLDARSEAATLAAAIDFGLDLSEPDTAENPADGRLTLGELPILAGSASEAVISNGPDAQFGGSVSLVLPINELDGERLDEDAEGMAQAEPLIRYGIESLFVGQSPIFIVTDGALLDSALSPLATDPTSSAALDGLRAAADFLEGLYNDLVQHPLLGTVIPGIGLSVNQLTGGIGGGSIGDLFAMGGVIRDYLKQHLQSGPKGIRFLPRRNSSLIW